MFYHPQFPLLLLPNSSHLLKMAVERKDDMMQELEEKHCKLKKRCVDLEEWAASLQNASEEARQTRSMALELRSKVRGVGYIV